jgi:hypothetical protein
MLIYLILGLEKASVSKKNRSSQLGLLYRRKKTASQTAV